jgi:small multidrug resistance pump
MNLTLLIECWASLAIAIIFGVLGTISMKIAMKYLELSVVYAVWSGIGTVLVSIVGVMYFGERLSLRKITFLLLIVCGVIGIHFGDGISTV